MSGGVRSISDRKRKFEAEPPVKRLHLDPEHFTSVGALLSLQGQKFKAKLRVRLVMKNLTKTTPKGREGRVILQLHFMDKHGDMALAACWREHASQQSSLLKLNEIYTVSNGTVVGGVPPFTNTLYSSAQIHLDENSTILLDAAGDKEIPYAKSHRIRDIGSILSLDVNTAGLFDFVGIIVAVEKTEGVQNVMTVMDKGDVMMEIDVTKIDQQVAQITNWKPFQTIVSFRGLKFKGIFDEKPQAECFQDTFMEYNPKNCMEAVSLKEFLAQERDEQETEEHKEQASSSENVEQTAFAKGNKELQGAEKQPASEKVAKK